MCPCSGPWIALSADTGEDYAFPLPITAVFWDRIVGARSLCILVGDWSKGRPAYVRSVLEELGYPTVQIGGTGRFATGRVAQNAREHAAVSELMDADAWLMPGDADLLPLDPHYYRPQRSGDEILAYCLYSNGDHFTSKESVLERHARGERFATLPTCHVLLRVSTWRELYGLTPGEDIGAATLRSMEGWLTPLCAGKSPSEVRFLEWMSDQDLLTYKLCSQEWFPAKACLVPRRGHPPIDRLCRSVPDQWRYLETYPFVDCHLLKGLYRPEAWPYMVRLMRRWLPDRLDWAERYRERYLREG